MPATRALTEYEACPEPMRKDARVRTQLVSARGPRVGARLGRWRVVDGQDVGLEAVQR